MSDRVDAFKHWIPNVLLKNWNQKNIDPSFKGNDCLLIYSIEDKDFIKDEYGKYIKGNSKSPKIPFGEKYYNNQFLENEIFSKIEKQ